MFENTRCAAAGLPPEKVLDLLPGLARWQFYAQVKRRRFLVLTTSPLSCNLSPWPQLILSWRTNYAGFKLQSSTALSSGLWSDCTNSPAPIGEQFFVTNSMSGGAQFFRLKK